VSVSHLKVILGNVSLSPVPSGLGDRLEACRDTARMTEDRVLDHCVLNRFGFEPLEEER
jgi:hypothetical protein